MHAIYDAACAADRGIAKEADVARYTRAALTIGVTQMEIDEAINRARPTAPGHEASTVRP